MSVFPMVYEKSSRWVTSKRESL